MILIGKRIRKDQVPFIYMICVDYSKHPGTILIITILLGRLCNLFSNYSLVNCTYSKRFIDVLGFTLKWLPSIGGVLMGILITIQIIGLIWNQVNTRQWCVNRFNESAVNAVKNCRLIHQGRAGENSIMYPESMLWTPLVLKQCYIDAIRLFTMFICMMRPKLPI